MKRNAVVEVISFLFVLLFVYAAASKLLDYEKFRIQLGQSQMLTPFANEIAWLIPSIEVLISLLLVNPSFRSIGLYASFSLMTMFTTYIIVVLNFSDFIPCSCGGLLEHMPWANHVIFNAVFILLALLGILSQPILGNKGELFKKRIWPLHTK